MGLTGVLLIVLVLTLGISLRIGICVLGKGMRRTGFRETSEGLIRVGLIDSLVCPHLYAIAIMEWDLRHERRLRASAFMLPSGARGESPLFTSPELISFRSPPLIFGGVDGLSLSSLRLDLPAFG